MPFSMSEAYQSLGQQKPAAGILTDLTTVPTGTQYISSSILICNQSGYTDYYRISKAIGGAADAPAQYIAFDVPLLANTTFAWTVGVTLAAGDKLRCYSRIGNISFNVEGSSIT